MRTRALLILDTIRVYVCCAYNPSLANSAVFLDEFENVLSMLTGSYVYVVGDFNIDLKGQHY